MAHRAILRGRCFIRRIFKPDSRKGDCAKNSARLPTRLVFRCHSSAPTTTAALCPFRVIVCGPSDIARSMISLNFALASATVQLCKPICISDGHSSHYSHSRPSQQLQSKKTRFKVKRAPWRVSVSSALKICSWLPAATVRRRSSAGVLLRKPPADHVR
jgi:hypothetical protein